MNQYLRTTSFFSEMAVHLGQVIRAMSMPERVYLASLVTLVVGGLVGTIVPLNSVAAQTVAVVGTHGFLIGFCLSAVPQLRALWSHASGKASIGVLNLVALLVSTALARHHVSLALGLPAQDFDLTVAVLALLFYLPAWSLLVSGIMLLTLLTLLLAMLLGAFTQGPASSVARRLAHCLGAFGVCIYSSQLFDWSAQEARPVNVAVRVIAMLCDYQPGSKYPGIKGGDLVRLHENGVVSSMTIGPDGPVVHVRKLEE